MYKYHLKLVIKYLKGEIDIYNGNHNETVNVWNQAWDEIQYMGYNPGTIAGISKYIREQL